MLKMGFKLFFGILLISLFVVSSTNAGDVFELSNPSDMLELREPIGDVWNTITEFNMPNFLEGGSLSTSQSSTDYDQYLRFFDSGNSIDNSPRVNYTENQGIVSGYVKDYLYIKDSDNPSNSSTAFFEYGLEFGLGLESQISGGKLVDLMGLDITFFNIEYNIIDTVADTANDEVTLFMWSSYVHEYLQEGQTKTYFINGVPYEVNVMTITSNPIKTILEVNGEITNPLENGQTFTLNDGTVVGVNNIILNGGGVDLVEVFLDVGKLEIKDFDYSDENFDQTVQVNGVHIINGLIKIKAVELSSATKLEISSIKYRLSADALNGDDVWVEAGDGVREYLDAPEGMINSNWDIRYEGLDNVNTSIIKFDPSGDDEYNLIFENMQGLVYNVPYITNEGNFKYGTNNRDLVFHEGRYNTTAKTAGNQTPNIGHLDYFVLSDIDQANGFDNEAISHVMRYGNYDSQNNELKFEDMATGETRLVTYSTTSPKNGTLGSGDLNVGGTTYKVYVGNATAGIPPLTIDMNANGSSDAEEVRITINGGGILDLGDHSNSTGGLWTEYSVHNGENLSGNWTNTGDLLNTGVSNVSLVTLQEDFDEDGPTTLNGPGNEYLNFTVRAMPSNEVGINKTDLWSNGGIGSLLEDEGNHDYYYGMTDYGALVTLYDASSSDNPETLTIEYPLTQRGVNVFIIEGEVENRTLPDLLISDISYSPNYLEAGDLVIVNLTLTNAGTAPVVGSFNWIYDFDYGSGLDSLVLNSGDSLNLSFSHVYNETGDHTFYFEVDPTNVIEELNETNNVVLLNIFVDGTPDLNPVLISERKDPNNKNNVLLSYRIHNLGDIYVDDFDYNIDFGDGTGAGGFIAERLNAGSYFDFNLSHEYNVAGMYSTIFKVDALNLIIELNETNNVVNTPVWIPCDKGLPGMITRCMAKRR